MKKSLGAKTIIVPTPVLVVCTYDGAGKPNAMAVAWGGICCSRPPCAAISLRKATYSFQNIVERKAFTINIPSEKYIKETDYFGTVSGKNEDKFVHTKLTPIKSTLVDAPYIEQFPLILECKMIHSIEIGLHTQFIGEIIDVKAEEFALDDTDSVCMAQVKPFMYSPDEHVYHAVGRLLGQAYKISKEGLE